MLGCRSLPCSHVSSTERIRRRQMRLSLLDSCIKQVYYYNFIFSNAHKAQTSSFRQDMSELIDFNQFQSEQRTKISSIKSNDLYTDIVEVHIIYFTIYARIGELHVFLFALMKYVCTTHPISFILTKQQFKEAQLKLINNQVIL